MRNTNITLALLASTSILAACASTDGEIFSQARQEASNSIPQTSQYWSAMAARSGDVQVGWIDAFNDPVLTRLVREAQTKNNDLTAASANVDRSWALAKQAGAALKPNLGLSGGGQRAGTGSSSGAGASSFNVGLQASWELDLWGRIRSGQQAAVSSAEAAEADYEFAQLSLAAGVARSYFLAIEAERQQEIAASIVEALTETARIVQVQLDNGLASPQDMALVKSDLASANDSFAAAQGGKRDAIRALELLLGRYPAADLQTVGLSLPDLPEEPPAGIPAEILERRPDLISAERRIAASLSGVNQAKAARLPQVSLTASTGGASSDLSSLLSPGNVAWTAASSLLVPILDGGALQAGVEVSTAEQKAAVASYAQAALTAFGEVESSLDQGQVLKRRRNAQEEATKQAEEALRLAQITYSEGEISLLDVLSIQQRVFGARSNLLSLRRSQLDQFVDLNLALGGDWRSDV